MDIILSSLLHWFVYFLLSSLQWLDFYSVDILLLKNANPTRVFDMKR